MPELVESENGVTAVDAATIFWSKQVKLAF
jgi:hypothetical protein